MAKRGATSPWRTSGVVALGKRLGRDTDAANKRLLERLLEANGTPAPGRVVFGQVGKHAAVYSAKVVYSRRPTDQDFEPHIMKKLAETMDEQMNAAPRATRTFEFLTLHGYDLSVEGT